MSMSDSVEDILIEVGTISAVRQEWPAAQKMTDEELRQLMKACGGPQPFLSHAQEQAKMEDEGVGCESAWMPFTRLCAGVQDLFSVIEAGAESLKGSLSNGIDAIMGNDTETTAQDWGGQGTQRKTVPAETGLKDSPAKMGVGIAGSYCKKGSEEVFVYHEEGLEVGAQQGSSMDQLIEDYSGSNNKITQTLLANTFFMAKGRSFQEMFDLKGKASWYSSVEHWRTRIMEVLRMHLTAPHSPSQPLTTA